MDLSLWPHDVAVTVIVTFTGASVDSCEGSELEVVVAVSMPIKNTNEQRRARRLGAAHIALIGQDRPCSMHETHHWSLWA